MFKAGDKIVHVRHGAGIVKEPRTITREGVDTVYFCVELSDNRGMIMVPADKVDNDEIRLAVTNIDAIEEVLQAPPELLQDDHRVRQNTIKENIKTHDPRILAATLRDLAWREYRDKITFTDAQLKDKAQRLLAQELALDPSVGLDVARKRISSILNEALVKYDNNGTKAKA